MSRQTGFEPILHGFRFSNGFVYDWHLFRRHSYFGLCGGMCHVALDLWRRGEPISAIETPPAQGSPLYRLLVCQQAVSMTPLAMARLTRRVLADQGINDRLTRDALPKVLGCIDAGDPTVLFVVRTYRAENPAKNHQVLCVGYDLDERLSRLRLDVYDPIYPCQPVAIHLELANPDGRLHASHSHGDVVRGLFPA